MSEKKPELILPGSHSVPERMRQFHAAGFTEEDGQGNITNPNLDPKSAKAKSVVKRLTPKGS